MGIPYIPIRTIPTIRYTMDAYDKSEFITLRLYPVNQENPPPIKDMYDKLVVCCSHFTISEEYGAKNGGYHFHAVVRFDPPLSPKKSKELIDSWGYFPSGQRGRNREAIKKTLEIAVTYMLKDGKYLYYGFPEDLIKQCAAKSYPKLDFNTELKQMEEIFLALENPGHSDVERLIYDRITLSHTCNRTYTRTGIVNWATILLHRANERERMTYVRALANSVCLTESYVDYMQLPNYKS